MSRLTQPYGERDPFGMTARIEGIPRQIERALERLESRPWPVPEHAPERLAVGGMGGSAIAADLTRGLYEDRLPRPLEVVRAYRWPGWVRGDALALLSSYSGDTEETLALYRDAGSRGVPRVALTTGGALGALCARDGVFVQPLPPGSPPRAALFASWVALTGLLHALDWIEDPVPGWREAAQLLRERDIQLGPASLEAENPAKRLARALEGRLVYVYAGAGPLEAVALRWRQQLHENAKVLAHSAVVPELDHNEIVGWERPGALHRGIAVVALNDPEDAPEIRTRLALTAEYARHQGAVVHDWEAPPGPRLARLASLVQLGDYLSLYLALLGGVDPTPIPSIDEFKRRLSGRGSSPA
jgi:glucose/mannose-6-phosphate isomerase